jgi:outer membrane lipoprotein-sorting protein
MIRPLFAALVIAFVPQEKPGPEVDGAQAAKALLDRVEAKVKAAKTIRFTVKVTMQAAMFEAAKEQEPLAGEILLRAPGEARLEITVEKAPLLIRSDGKIVVVEGDVKPTMKLPREPKALMDMLRKVAVLGFIAFQPDEDETKIEMKPVNFMIGGREKVEGVDTQVLSYDFKSSQPMLDRLTVRVWIDPARLTVVKREYDIRAFARLTEVLSKVAYDEELPADEFALQSMRSVRVAVEGQVARSVELYARYMGRLPERLEDLDAPPKDAAFWPEGGFWIGGKRPELKYSVANGVATIGQHTVPAPAGGRITPTSDRLKRHYTSRVRLHLVRAAVEAWHKAYSRLPEKIEHLAVKPEEIEFFPDGGYVSTAMLKDPGGEALILTVENTAVNLSVAKKNERVIKEKQLTPQESVGLKSGAFPAGTPESR